MDETGAAVGVGLSTGCITSTVTAQLWPVAKSRDPSLATRTDTSFAFKGNPAWKEHVSRRREGRLEGEGGRKGGGDRGVGGGEGGMVGRGAADGGSGRGQGCSVGRSSAVSCYAPQRRRRCQR